MWETIKSVFTSGNGIGLGIIISLLVVIIIYMAIKLGKAGLLTIQTKHFRIGNKVTERELIRRQIEKAHSFVMSIEGKIPSDQNYKEYLVKYILEKIYDEVIKWIMFNHITVNQLYIEDKQNCILNLIYSMPINEDFKTPEFKERVCKWVYELIEQLVNTKKLYSDITITGE